MNEAGRAEDEANVRALIESSLETGVWHCLYRVDKYEDGREPDGHPDEVLEGEGNLLVNVGIQTMLDLLARNTGTAFTTGAAAHLAAGSNAGAAGAGDTALGTILGIREVATATVSGQVVTFQATFAAGQATGAWEEVGAFNALAAGEMLNHLVTPLGTKVAGAAWVLTLTITIS